MKKFFFFLLFTIGFASLGFAQTKKIAHRSHSGVGKVFASNDDDNYGNPPIHYKETRDSLLKKADLQKAEQQKVDSAAKTKAKKPVATKPKSKSKQKQ
jgi:hypothetical protein